MQSFKIGTVVNITKIEHKNVQIGSAIIHLGQITIRIAAITTPIDWIISPRM